ncbi:MAG: cadmium-translocating P-type ATPase [Candidatus Hydrogenedentota bacterium]|nr:MAG: cadmium-translocating P-type ATPase [Candidatus Hydrogenedentota bacterium]
MSEENCYHCGDKLGKKVYTYDEKKFCCSGCLNVYVFIKESGNENYYKFRDELPEKPKFDSASIPYEVVEENIVPDKQGYKSAEFLLEGLHCASCVWLNEKILEKLDGVIQKKVTFATGRVFLKWNPDQTSLEQIANSLLKAGYRIRPIQVGNNQPAKKDYRLLKKTGVAGFFAGNIMLISTALYAGNFSGMDWFTQKVFYWISWLMATPVFFYSASEFFLRAYAGLKNKIISMDLLTALGLSLAYFYSVWAVFFEKGEPYFDAVCFVTFAVLSGRLIESSLREKFFIESENLMARLPLTAKKVLSKERLKTKEVFVDQIAAGDILQVDTGEVIPVDGILLDQEALIDESVLTGESIPISKKKGETIYAGSSPADKPIYMEVLKSKAESSLAKLQTMSEEALARGAQSGFLDTVAKAFIIFVLVAGGATAIWWKFILGASIAETVYHVMAVFIVACPCALTLSVPMAHIRALKKAYKNKILAKGEFSIFKLASSKKVFFDKTGTLTEGQMKIQRIETFTGYQKEFAISLAKSMQESLKIKSPIARAFLQQQAKSLPFKEIQFYSGKGISGNYRGRRYYLGSANWLMSKGYHFSLQDDSTAVLLADETKIVAVFYLSDTIRKGMDKVIDFLQKKREVFMLSGDRQDVCQKVAAELNIVNVYCEVLPEDKKKIIEEHAPRVAMIGDGMNDAAALATSDCGISFAKVSEISANAADILLLNPDSKSLLALFQIAAKAKRILSQNLALAFLYNSLLIPAAFIGLLSPLFGAVFMSLSSISVVLNALRLR